MEVRNRDGRTRVRQLAVLSATAAIVTVGTAATASAATSTPASTIIPAKPCTAPPLKVQTAQGAVLLKITPARVSPDAGGGNGVCCINFSC
jgi:hypothetical protein